MGILLVIIFYTTWLSFTDNIHHLLSPIETTYAASGNPTVVYIKGNYNGVVAKTISGNITYLLSLPSIIMNANTGTTLVMNTNTGFFVHGMTNSGGVAFAPQVVFSSGALPATNTERLTLATNIANAYSGSTFPDPQPFVTAMTNSNSGTLLTSLAGGLVSGSLGGKVSSTTNNSNTTTFSLSANSVVAGGTVTITDNCTSHPTSYSSSVAGVVTIIGTTITSVSAGTTNITPVGGNCGDITAKTLTVTAAPNSCATDPVFSNLGTLTRNPTSVNQAWTYSATPGNCTYTCTGGYSGASCATAPVLWTVLGGGDCTAVDNVQGTDGATSSCIDNRTYTFQGVGATHNKTYALLKIAGVWWFNQNLAYPPATGYSGNGTWSATDTGLYSCPGNNSTTTADCTLVSTLGYLYQWSSAMAGASSNNNPAARTQGICPSGWGLPTKADFTTTGDAYWPASANDFSYKGNTTGWTRTYAGYRNNDAVGTFGNRASNEFTWSSFEYSSTNAWFELFATGGPTQSIRTNLTKSDGFSLRCLKN